MEYVDWVSFDLSFLLVIALLGATLWGLKRFGRMQLQSQSGQASIKLIDSFSLQQLCQLVKICIEVHKRTQRVHPHIQRLVSRPCFLPHPLLLSVL